MPSLSHSQTELWDKCQLSWAHSKVYRTRQAPADNLILGDAVHQAFELDGNAWRTGDTRMTYFELVEAFRYALHQRLTRDDPDNLLAHKYNHMTEAGTAILSAYVEHLQPKYQPDTTEEDLKRVSIPGAPDWTFTGRVDARIGLEVVDFKTANKPWAQGLEHSKDQASAYLLADQLGRAHQAAVKVTFHVFPVSNVGGDLRCYPQLDRSTTRTPSQLFAYQEHLRTVAEDITEAKKSGDFKPKTSPLCAWCGYLGSCDAGLAHLKATGRSAAVPVLRKAS